MVVSLKNIIGACRGACCGASPSPSRSFPSSPSSSFPSSGRRGRNKKKQVDRIITPPDDVNNNQPVDRISLLPDDVIYHILSFISIKYAIRTSVLSKRWKHIHKSLPYFNLDDVDDGILDLDDYYGMVINLLSNRDSESPVSAFSLRYDSKRDHSLKFESMLKNVIHSAISANINDMRFYDFYDNSFPHDVLKSKSLKHLHFTGSIYNVLCTRSEAYIKCKTSDWYLPALVSLHLELAEFGNEGNVDLFSKFENLKHLKLINCFLANQSEIEIFGPQLESLTLVNTLQFVVSESDYIKCKISDWYLPALVSLHLEQAKLDNEGSGSNGNVDLFSRFENLKHLKLINCITVNPSQIEISGPRLESLTLVDYSCPPIIPTSPQLSRGCIECKTSDWYLPALISLHLQGAALGDVHLFSRFKNLKHLKLINCAILNPSEHVNFTQSNDYANCKTSGWDFPALLSLHLGCVAIGSERIAGNDGNYDPFKYKRMKHLKLIWIVSNPNNIEIFCPRLENLTLANNFCKFVVFAPKLLSLCYNDFRLLEVSMSVPCLKLSEVKLHVGDSYSNQISEKSELMRWLQQFSSTKFLTLRNRAAMVLFVGLDLEKHQPYSPFTQLQRFDIEKCPSFTLSDELIVDKVTSYFLASSSSATVNLI